jgi:hypothetical protein
MFVAYLYSLPATTRSTACIRGSVGVRRHLNHARPRYADQEGKLIFSPCPDCVSLDLVIQFFLLYDQ